MLSISFQLYGRLKFVGGRTKPYPIIFCHYSFHRTDRFSPHPFFEGDVNRPRWSITVYSVPSDMKATIEGLLKTEGLPKIHQWFCAREKLTGQQAKQDFWSHFDESKQVLLFGKPYYL
jgi:hypothetical protein